MRAEVEMPDGEVRFVEVTEFTRAPGRMATPVVKIEGYVVSAVPGKTKYVAHPAPREADDHG